MKVLQFVEGDDVTFFRQLSDQATSVRLEIRTRFGLPGDPSGVI